MSSVLESMKTEMASAIIALSVELRLALIEGRRSDALATYGKLFGELGAYKMAYGPEARIQSDDLRWYLVEVHNAHYMTLNELDQKKGREMAVDRFLAQTSIDERANRWLAALNAPNREVKPELVAARERHAELKEAAAELKPLVKSSGIIRDRYGKIQSELSKLSDQINKLEKQPFVEFTLDDDMRVELGSILTDLPVWLQENPSPAVKAILDYEDEAIYVAPTEIANPTPEPAESTETGKKKRQGPKASRARQAQPA